MPRKAPIFELGRELGRGTTGRVRLGTLSEPFADLPAGSPVAVKELEAAAEPAVREAFRREAWAGRDVSHPHLVRVLYSDEDRPDPYLVMGFVPGQTLRQVLEEHGRLPEPRVRAVGRQLAGALAALHGAGWRHGDVKPENVRLDGEGNAVLLDLGFALRGDGDGRDGARPGSVPYLSPEQAAGDRGSPGGDVYALGILLHELATGEHPFPPPGGEPEGDGAAPEAWLAAIRAGGTVLPSRIVPRLSPLFDALVRSLLAVDPLQRPSAAQIQEILARGEASDWWRQRVAFGAGAPREPRAGSGRFWSPMVGRDEELARLEAAFEKAQSRPRGGCALWLEGEGGSGKSRLVSEFAARARCRAEPPLHLYGRGTEFQDERPGQAVRSLLRRWLHLPRDAAPGPRERELLAQLVAPATARILLRALDPSRVSPAPRAEASALAQWLVHLGREGPLIVFLDDLTFAGEATFEVLTRVVDRLQGTRMLLLLGLRWGTPARLPVPLENLRARLALRAPTETIALGPLTREAVLELVEELFHHTAPRLRLARVLHERSDGLPGSITEMIRNLQARGRVRPRADGDGRLELLVSPDELGLPRTVERLIAERYGELAPLERLWLERLAAVGGRPEPEFLLRAFPPTTPAELDAVLAVLVEQGWLTPIGSRYRFTRPVQREVVYRTIPDRRRVRIHAAAAQTLEDLAVDRPSSALDFQRAFHLHEAGEHCELLGIVRPLVRRTLESGHPLQVHTLATWGLDAIEALPPPSDPERDRLRIDLLEAAADAADRLGHRRHQRELLDRLSDLDIDPQRDPVAAGRVYLLHGRYAANTGRYGLCRGLLRNAMDLFEKGGAASLECAATLRLAHVQGHVGQLAEAGRLARAALRLATDEPQRARAHLALAVAAMVGDQFEVALRLIDRATKSLRRLEDPTGGRGALAAAHLLRGRTYRLVGRPRRAFVAIQRAARLAAQAGERRLEAETSARMGRLYLDLDRPREAELQLREALLQCQEIEYRRGQALASVFLGILLGEGGDPEAAGVLARATALAHEIGLSRMEALGLALGARVARQADDPSADALSARALDLLERFGAELADRVVIVATRALLLAEQGRSAEAQTLERALAARVRRVNESIEAPVLRQRQHRASAALLASARSPEGPIYPRLALPDLPAPLSGPAEA